MILFLFHLSTCPSLLILVLTPYAALLTIVILSTLIATPTSETLTETKKFNMTWVGNLFYPILPLSLILTAISITVWSGSATPILLGHLLINKVSLKLLVVFSLIGAALLLAVQSPHSQLTKTNNDLNSFLVAFVYFAPLLFLTNSLISFIFIIELLTTQIFVLVVLWDVNQRNTTIHLAQLTNARYRSAQTPLDALFFFFWTSFLVALTLFTLLSLLISTYSLSDWAISEFLMDVILLGTPLSEMSPLLIIMLALFLILMLKLALAPFFFWKPIFFAVLHIPALFFYTVFFYSLLLTWIVLFWFSLNALLTKLIILPLIGLLSIGFITILMSLGDSSSLRGLIAISSVFNTLLIWLTFTVIGNPTALPY
uniref:Nad2_a n=1 Tax=Urostyla grandis TaxID=57509 RepID=A0A2I4PEL6_9SPIT|nr:Nad2_a [Urostyla grandis]